MSATINRREWMKSMGLGTLAASLGCTTRWAAAAAQAGPLGPKGYALPPLPYGYAALAPGLEEGVLRLHHGKHHAGYVKGLNSTLQNLAKARAENDFSQIKALSRDLAFHGSGHVLHSLYWVSMAPDGSAEPTGELRAALARDFGSFDAFKAQFLAAAKEVEGSGWAVLAYEPVGETLLVLQAEKHQNLAFWGAVPLLVCDVWEHAYYDQYQNRRGEYVDNFSKLIDWPGLARRHRGARVQSQPGRQR